MQVVLNDGIDDQGVIDIYPESSVSRTCTQIFDAEVL
jgi:hypothetical protein